MAAEDVIRSRQIRYLIRVDRILRDRHPDWPERKIRDFEAKLVCKYSVRWREMASRDGASVTADNIQANERLSRHRGGHSQFLSGDG